MFVVLVLFTAVYLAPMLGLPLMGCLSVGAVVLVTDISLRAGARSFASIIVLSAAVVLLMVALSPQVAHLLPRNATIRDVTAWLDF